MAKSVSVDLDFNKELLAAQAALEPAVKRLKRELAKLDVKSTPVGLLADSLYELTQLKSAVGKLGVQIEALVEAKNKELEDNFINTLSVGESSGVQGMISRVQITESVVPVFDKPEAREKFLAHVVKNKLWDLVKVDIMNREAVRERWEQKVYMPGVGKFIAKKVSRTKLAKGKKKAA